MEFFGGVSQPLYKKTTISFRRSTKMLNENQLINEVLQNTKAFLGLNQLPKLSDRFIEDLNFDSLDTIEYIMRVEELFDIEIDDCEAEKLISIEDLVKCIKNKL